MISKFSVKKPYTVIVGVVMVLLLGIISFTKTTTDLLPEMELPYVVVYTTYPGASAEKVESNVTKILESSLSTTENLLNTTSVSSDNLSLVVLEFAEDTNMDTVKIDLNTKINQAIGFLDDGVGTPMMMAINPNMLPIMVATVDYEGKDLLGLSEFVSKNVENELLKAGGVADVSLDGLLKETIQITFDDTKIDSINNRILNSVNSELAKADKELNDGLKEVNEGLAKLEDGEKELDDKKDESFNSLSEMTVMLNEAASQLITMDNQIVELNAQKLAYQKVIDSLNPIINEAKKMFNLNDESDINLLLDTININIETLRDIIDGFDIDSINGFIDKLINNPMIDQEFKDILISLSDNETIKEYINSNLDKLNNVLEQLVKLQEAIVSYNDASIRLPQLEIEISTAEAVKKSAIDILNKAGIDTSDLKSLQAKLESGKLVATNEITKAEITLSSTKAKLEATKKELETAKEKLEESKKEALKSANIDSLLTSDMLSNILMAENFDMPAGYLKGDNSLLVKVGEEFDSLEELNNLLLVSMDVDGLEEIKLSDVANVSINDNSSELYTKVNGNDAVILTIQKTSTSSTSEVSKNVKESFEKLESEYEGLNFTSLMDQGIYIDIIIDSVLDNFIVGGSLAIIVLIIFLRNFKTTLIIALSIPISFMFAMVLMYFSGISLNIISLSGLALGVGMLVDNSVVVVENIYRLKNEGLDIKEASIEGAKQVSVAIFASTLTTICVFLPIIFTEGLTRQLFTDMALTIAYSLIASLIVALTLVPTLSSLLLKKTNNQKHNFFNKMVNMYENSLRWALSHRLAVMIVVLVLLVVSFVRIKNMGMELMPTMDSYQMSLTVKTSGELVDKERYQIYDEIMTKVKSIDEIEAIGVSENNGSNDQTNKDEMISNTFYIVAKQDADINKLKEMIPSVLKNVDAVCNLSTSQMDMSSLGGSGISMNLYGDDLDKLKEAAKIIEDKLLTVEGIKEVDNGLNETMVELNIIVDKNEAMKYGLTVAQVYGEIASQLKSETSSINLNFNDKNYPLVIVKENIHDINELYNIDIKAKKNNETVDIKLEDIATFENGQAMNAVNRENGRRYMTISASLDDNYNVSLVSRDVKQLISEDMINGVDIEFDGENETIIEAMIELIKMILLAIAFIYMIMVAQFQSLKYPFIVMFTIPLAFTGGLIAIELSGLNLSVVAMLGFLVLSGIVVNNGIVLIDYINQLREKGIDNKESLVIAGKTRLRPILMTALTTILAMTSMALGMGSGSQMMQGMAVVTIGGLTYATLLTIYVVPILMSLMDKKENSNG